MKVLLTGSNGQVGWEVRRQAEDHGVTLVATDRESLDITDAAGLDRAIDADIDLVVNAAAYTAVDQAESEPEAAHAVNAVAPGSIARQCEARGIPLIHLSTDYVFDGASTRAWREDDPVNPLGVYGQSKLEGENAVRTHTDRHVILRTSWVFGVHGNNFVKTMLRLADERDELTVVADQIGCPTFAGSIAAAILTIANELDQGQTVFGTYHFCDDGPTTWHSFARHIIDRGHRAGIVRQTPAVEPIPTRAFPTPARRPAYSVLNTRKFADTFSAFDLRAWHDGVDAVIEAARKAV